MAGSLDSFIHTHTMFPCSLFLTTCPDPKIRERWRMFIFEAVGMDSYLQKQLHELEWSDPTLPLTAYVRCVVITERSTCMTF